MSLLTWTILCAAWGLLAYEYNTGRKNITVLEGGLFWTALSFATVTALLELLQ